MPAYRHAIAKCDGSSIIARLLGVAIVVSVSFNCCTLSVAADANPEEGYRLLRSRTYVPPDFDQDVFKALWKTWPEPFRSHAANASPLERRKMTFSRYGLMEDPDNDDPNIPALGYVDDGKRGWVMNCLICHAGKVAGRVIPGLPNSHLALHTLIEDVRKTKIALFKPPAHMDIASLSVPLGKTNGTTNAVAFGVLLGALRDRDMNVDHSKSIPPVAHHDLDAPPLWNVKKKSSLYADGFSPKNHRVLMQFMLLPTNDAETVKSWESDFRHILAWIESLEPPKYPWPYDESLAAKGRKVFERNCSRCHGTYGEGGSYQQKIVPIDTVGTDPRRLRALSTEHRQWMRDGWLSRYGRDPVLLDPGGYVAPPLDGVWASAPYFHNGSVPTLWHVLHPDERPIVWKRTENGYDRKKGGLEIKVLSRIPPKVKSAAERRQYFDTRKQGKSAAGHRFPDLLEPEEKRAVLEYLKTL